MTSPARLALTINDRSFSNPELAYEEATAHDTLVEALQIERVRATPHAYGIPTALEAEFGSGGRVLTFNTEYDALPGIGHACGHNPISTSNISEALLIFDRTFQSARRFKMQ
ncbi:hypothetical protein A1O1_01455 [Capronia coronata CBS 617.96]|uniref:Amidohydrolase n=1 Tax=Capronia coronata CBS 617.96 TaxID=1182541 RepID=W9ZPD8_9EURO|nr:uncharacterized protein A1O1_01455 [Capronia coronata CBS 617.96]EXJ96329.1 hypothetical protein A1O1_01455 [Capronia coronata CBS 617.96]